MITYSFCILDLHCVISESKKKIFSSDIVEVRKGMHTVSIPLKHSVALTGDIRMDFFNRPKMKRKVFIRRRLKEMSRKINRTVMEINGWLLAI